MLLEGTVTESMEQRNKVC